jgi:tetratricopeptide (TPR) repeat protein/predicted aspartyl protease
MIKPPTPASRTNAGRTNAGFWGLGVWGLGLWAAALWALAAPALAECRLGGIAEFKVTMNDRRPLVETTINGAEAVFVADSGDFYSEITPAKAAEFGLRLGPAPFNLTVDAVGGEVQRLAVATVKAFGIVGVTLSNKEFLVGGSETGNDTAGLIGQNILGIADTDYDLANGAIRLIEPRGCGGKALAYWAGTKPFSIVDYFPVGQIFPTTGGTAYVNGARIRVMFDTGASQSLLSLSAARRAGIDPTGPGVTSAGLSGGVGRHAVETWIAPVDSFKIGDEEIKHTHLRIGQLPPETDMLLGADFFLSHHVYVSKAQRKIYFTYNGGPVFDLSTGLAPLTPTPVAAASPAAPGGSPAPATSTAAAPAEPSDAEGFSRRGEAFVSRRDFQHGIADLTRAIALAPAEPRFLEQRAQAYLENGQLFLAMADLDQTLKLKPSDTSALALRAGLRLSGRDTTGALADLDAVDGLAVKEADVRFTLAELYERADALAPAIRQDDLWIAAHPDDSRRGLALNERCWLRARLGQDLDKAAADCDAARRAEPKLILALCNRGLVRLRQGDLDRAISDYDACLATRPHTPWALYGRGLAKRRKGLKADGDADIAAALVLRPGIAADARAHGIGT